jgi:hypothetical protein
LVNKVLPIPYSQLLAIKDAPGRHLLMKKSLLPLTISIQVTHFHVEASLNADLELQFVALDCFERVFQRSKINVGGPDLQSANPERIL